MKLQKKNSQEYIEQKKYYEKMGKIIRRASKKVERLIEKDLKMTNSGAKSIFDSSL